MLTLSRADSPITCHLEQRERTEANRWVQHLTRSLRVTAASLPLTLLTFLGPRTLAGQQPPPGLVEVRDTGTRHGFWFGPPSRSEPAGRWARTGGSAVKSSPGSTSGPTQSSRSAASCS
jgi:hypothetical protein